MMWALARSWVLRFALSVILITWLLHSAGIYELVSLAGRYTAAVFAGLFALHVFSLLLSGIKWKILLPCDSVGRLFRLTVISQLYSIVLPGQIAGEAIKAYRLGRGRPDAEQIAASVVVDKVTGLQSLLMVGLAGAGFGASDVTLPLVPLLALAFLASIVLLFGVRLDYLFRIILSGVAQGTQWLPRANRIFGQLTSTVHALHDYVCGTSRIAASVAVGILPQVVNIAIIDLAARQLGIEVGLADWCWIFATVSLAMLLPISIGGIGLREGAFVGLLALIDVPAAAALALSLTIFGLQILGALLGAVFEMVGTRPGN